MVTPLWILSSLVAVAAAIAFSLNHKHVGLWISYAAIILGLASFFAYLHTKIAERENERFPQFSVVSEVWIHGEKRHKPAFFIVHGYGKRQMASPVNDIFYVRFTNTGAEPLMVDYLGVELSKDGHKWTPAFLLDVFQGGDSLYFVKDSFTTADYLVPQKPRLSEAIRDKNIGPRETVKGFLFAERPEGFDGERCKWRVKVTNLNGIEGFAEITEMPNRAETFAGASFTVVAKADISQFQVWYYSERDKLR